MLRPVTAAGIPTSQGRAELAPMDVLMLKGDTDPRTRAVITGVLVLDAVPEWADLMQSFERACHHVPRMRQRVLKPGLPGLPPEWAEDPEFDLDYHVRRVGAPGSGTLDEVLDLAAAISTAPLDAARPLWEALLVDNLTDGGAVLVLRAHHAVTDGLGAVEILAALLDLGPDGSGTPPEAATAEGPDRFWRDLLQHGSTKPLRLTLRRNRRLLELSTRTMRSPQSTVRSAARVGGSLRRMVSRPIGQPSALLRERSRRRVFRIVELPLEDLRSAGKTIGCTVNDAYLAALLGGFRRYHEELGEPVGDLPFALPLNIRPEGDTSAGNHISVGRLPGPARIEDPQERIRAVHALVAELRAEPALNVIGSVAGVLQHVPSVLAVRGLNAHAQQVDLHASNVMGAPFRVYLAGTKVERMVPFGPLSGVPVMTVMLSYDGTCAVGVTIDPAAVTDPDLFMRCLEEGFAEVCGSTATPGLFLVEDAASS